MNQDNPSTAKVGIPLTLHKATLVARRKRFFADLLLADGTEIVSHCANTGSMKNCLLPQSSCFYSVSGNPKRKLKYTLEYVSCAPSGIACVNTQQANRFVGALLAAGTIEPLRGYEHIQPEAKYADKCRFDFLLQQDGHKCWVEVKSVTLGVGNGLGLFPDSPSVRAVKHLEHLCQAKHCGDRAVLVFAVLNSSIEQVAPAAEIHPSYAQALREAANAGVEVMAVKANLQSDGLWYAGACKVLV